MNVLQAAGILPVACLFIGYSPSRKATAGKGLSSGPRIIAIHGSKPEFFERIQKEMEMDKNQQTPRVIIGGMVYTKKEALDLRDRDRSQLK